MSRQAVAAAIVGLALALAGCGGDDEPDPAAGPDSAALTEAFGEGAEKAYADAGKNRADDFAQGVVLEECFVADAETATAIGEAGAEDGLVFGDDNYLSGVPGEEERLGCATEAEGDERPAIFMLTVGTTLATPEQFRERMIRNRDEASEIEGEVPNLDPESVIAIEGDGISEYVWVQDDFFVGVGGPTNVRSSDEGFAALDAAVAGVERTLTE